MQYEQVVESICDLNWEELTPDQLTSVAIIYYYFSIQFRENLQIARELYPDDGNLIALEAGECNTDNLSPWPGVALAGEKLDHDEFMRRLLELSPFDRDRRIALDAIGQRYLASTRALEPGVRAMSIASYEDRGLEKVFTAILTCRHWNSALLQAFRHFLREHVRFDEDPEQGHGALARHLAPDDRVLPLWVEFRRILVEAVPTLQA
jgi:hypothetical protein